MPSCRETPEIDGFREVSSLSEGDNRLAAHNLFARAHKRAQHSRYTLSILFNVTKLWRSQKKFAPKLVPRGVTFGAFKARDLARAFRALASAS